MSCRHHLYLEVNPTTGSIKFIRPDVEVWDMAESCSLDVADRALPDDPELTLEDVGLYTNLTRERVRQIEVAALLKLSKGTLP